MANAFSKEEIVAFEDILEGFNDSLVLSKNVSVYNTDSTEMERSANIIWRPQPFVAQSFAGTDQTTNFNDSMQLSVPATIGFNRSSPWILSATELRDSLKEGRLGEAAKQKLASDIKATDDPKAKARLLAEATRAKKEATKALDHGDSDTAARLMRALGMDGLGVVQQDADVMRATIAPRHPGGGACHGLALDPAG